jgi:hypothetical protein
VCGRLTRVRTGSGLLYRHHRANGCENVSPTKETTTMTLSPDEAHRQEDIANDYGARHARTEPLPARYRPEDDDKPAHLLIAGIEGRNIVRHGLIEIRRWIGEVA